MIPLISSVRVETIGNHDRVQVWNRGGLAGTLMVCAGDGDAIAELLQPGLVRARAELRALGAVVDAELRLELRACEPPWVVVEDTNGDIACGDTPLGAAAAAAVYFVRHFRRELAS